MLATAVDGPSSAVLRRAHHWTWRVLRAEDGAHDAYSGGSRKDRGVHHPPAVLRVVRHVRPAYPPGWRKSSLHGQLRGCAGIFLQVLLLTIIFLSSIRPTRSSLTGILCIRQGYECPATYNPADFFIHTLAVTPGAEETSRVAIKRICDHFAVSDAAHEVDLVVRLERHIGSTFDEVGFKYNLHLSFSVH